MEKKDSNDLFISHERRKTAIQLALMRLKKKNEDFLNSLETNTKWRKIYNGLLYNNSQAQLSQLIQLELCSANDQQEKSFFNPFQKIPIKICYNKINKQQVFEQTAIYNLMLHYDSKTKLNMNWNNIQQTAKSTARALHISEICKKTDRNCFEEQLKKRVFEKQRFKGKEYNFEEIYQKGISDMAPISQIGTL